MACRDGARHLTGCQGAVQGRRSARKQERAGRPRTSAIGESTDGDGAHRHRRAAGEWLDVSHGEPKAQHAQQSVKEDHADTLGEVGRRRVARRDERVEAEDDVTLGCGGGTCEREHLRRTRQSRWQSHCG